MACVGLNKFVRERQKDADGRSMLCRCGGGLQSGQNKKDVNNSIQQAPLSYSLALLQVEEWRSAIYKGVCSVYIFNVHILCIKQYGCKGSHQSV